MSESARSSSILLELPDARLAADLALPAAPAGLIVFVHGSGSSRLSHRNRWVAEVLQARGFATLLFDLLMPEEDRDYARRFDIPLLTRRVLNVMAWVESIPELRDLALGLFGASTGAAAALEAAARSGLRVAAVVSRGGRPDLAMASLPSVRSPTLLIVGGEDTEVLALNEEALDALVCVKELSVVPGATHLFEEAGTLAEAARLAADWFCRHCQAQA